MNKNLMIISPPTSLGVIIIMCSNGHRCPHCFPLIIVLQKAEGVILNANYPNTLLFSIRVMPLLHASIFFFASIMQSICKGKSS